MFVIEILSFPSSLPAHRIPRKSVVLSSSQSLGAQCAKSSFSLFQSFIIQKSDLYLDIFAKERLDELIKEYIYISLLSLVFLNSKLF